MFTDLGTLLRLWKDIGLEIFLNIELRKRNKSITEENNFFEKIPRSHTIEPIIVENIKKTFIWTEIKVLSPYLGTQEYCKTAIKLIR